MGMVSDLLKFVTGADAIPPLGFSPPLTAEFHQTIDYPDDVTSPFPYANTCTNKLRLPVLDTYNEFKTNMINTICLVTKFGEY